MSAIPENVQARPLTFRRFKDGDSKPLAWQAEIFDADHSHKCPTYVQSTPPCQGSCPSGEDIRGYLNIVRGVEKPPAGVPWQEYAWRRLTEANPLPSVMGRVCPAPCESGCNRNEVEDFVGINSVEHFLGEWAIQNQLAFPQPAERTGKKVAVVGGGPAGLSVAYQLARKGHSVTIFDALTYAGNMDNVRDLVDDVRCSFVHGDICDAAAVEEALSDQPDAIVHFAYDGDRWTVKPNFCARTLSGALAP